MIVITAHNMMDFDALASMVAARCLYPLSQLAFSGIYARSIKDFVALNKELLDIRDIRLLDGAAVERLVVVDTANPKRLQHFDKLLQKPDLPIEIYDHHPEMPGDLAGSRKQVERIGATATLLTEKLQAKGVVLNEFEATTIALGIYSDTGGMLYNTTTPRDVRAACWLLEQGANLEVIRENMDQRFNDQQMQVFQQCLLGMQTYAVRGVTILLCQAETAARVAGLDVVTTRLLAAEGADAIFTLVQDPKGVEIVGRSSTSYVDVAAVLSPFGGRGHIRAASVNVKKSRLPEVLQRLQVSIDENIHAARCARDIMSSPVKTLLPDTSLEEADKIMLRYGHSGMPVIQNGAIVGMISRRDVDKARMHNLEHAPIKGFMSTQLVAAQSDTPIEHLQALIVDHDIGRIPIIENGMLLGIVSRTDILREIYQRQQKTETVQSDEVRPQWNYAGKMRAQLPDALLHLLYQVGEIAQKNQQKLYVVGGFVRDLLLGVPNQDIDLVVEGDGSAFAAQVAEKLQGELTYHERFQTANVVLPNQLSLDIVTARAEYYEYPAALPQVEKSCIREDMYRRDFTINAMALCLNPECFGDLIDFFGGRQDLKNGLIRVLYHFSFIEDPTRILRAVRFAQRYDFKIETDTWKFAKEALGRDMLSRLSPQRFWHEIRLILKEDHPAPALQKLQELNIWKHALPKLEPSQQFDDRIFERTKEVLFWWQEHINMDYQMDLIFLLLLLLGLPAEERCQLENELELKQKTRQQTEKVTQILPWLTTADWEHIALSEVDDKLQGLSPEMLIYCLIRSQEAGQKVLQSYLRRRQELKNEQIDGNLLKALGVKAGPEFSTILKRLRRLYLDGVLHSPAESSAYVQKWIKEEFSLA